MRAPSPRHEERALLRPAHGSSGRSQGAGRPGEVPHLLTGAALHDTARQAMADMVVVRWAVARELMVISGLAKGLLARPWSWWLVV